jgi:RNA polymerase sigma-70 factor (ECF subfamily)
MTDGRIDTSLQKILQSGVAVNASEAVESVYRSDWGRIVAALIGLIGDFDLAEESAQEAFTAASEQWRSSEVPEFPRAWIIQTARHKAIDRLRRQKRFEEKIEAFESDISGPRSTSPITTPARFPTIVFG